MLPLSRNCVVLPKNFFSLSSFSFYHLYDLSCDRLLQRLHEDRTLEKFTQIQGSIFQTLQCGFPTRLRPICALYASAFNGLLHKGGLNLRLVFKPSEIVVKCTQTLQQTYSPEGSASCVQSFDDSLIVQFALRIAFRCVLHRCGSLDIRC